jgi:hypothetical protein
MAASLLRRNYKGGRGLKPLKSGGAQECINLYKNIRA